MRNAVGREIPDELLTGGREVFQGNAYRDGYTYTKVGPTVRASVMSKETKVVADIRAAIEACGMKDGMTISFHHHFRDGDYIVNQVMQVIRELGLRDITVAASSLGSANDVLAQCIEEGIVTGKLRKFYEENCLLQQSFVKDGSMSVEAYIASAAKAAGGSLTFKSAVRFEKGEGIEKKQENFAEEIASMVKG